MTTTTIYPLASVSGATATISATGPAMTCTSDVYQIPTTDAACASYASENMSSAFTQCCKGNGPVQYDNGCGIYCLAQEQTVQDLANCLMSRSNNYGGVFCNDNQPNATATTPPSSTPGIATSTPTGTGGIATSTSNHNSAVMGASVSKMGMGVLALLFGSTLMGVLA